MQIVEPLVYVGPNRRSANTVIEWSLRLSPAELQSLRQVAPGGLHDIRAKLDDIGCKMPPVFAEDKYEFDKNEAGPVLGVGLWIAEMALAMQQAAGHRLSFREVLPGRVPDQCQLIFEYEHPETGTSAGELAIRILTESISGLEWEEDDESPTVSIENAYGEFLAEAARHVLPPSAQAIIDAAARLDVPCVKLERPPYSALEGDFRVRRNGLLKLGHSCYQHIVDGTLCVDRNPGLAAMLFDRERLHHCMAELGFPAPKRDREFRNVITAKRAVRSAERIGYPVVLKSARRSLECNLHAGQRYRPLGSAAEVKQVFDQVSGNHHRVTVEQHISGTTLQLLLANHEAVCLIDTHGSPIPLSKLHTSILDAASRTSKTLDAGLLNITLVTPDPGRPLTDVGGAIVDLDPAPRLDQLLETEPGLMDRAAEGFVRWLYPPGTQSRTPLVSVTGTNGKTTTSRMIARIMRDAGFSPGMASTSGVYLNEKLHKSGDLAGFEGHHFLFESRDIDMCVLETARGGIANSGFMFDWCDVAVCLNVTDDHLGEYGINTVEDMAVLKRSVLERARRAVVLNADYQACRNMLPFNADVDVYLASLETGAAGIRAVAGEQTFACVVEESDGEEWITLYEPDGTRSPVIPVAAIPATLGGSARFNVSNAQHAICACHALGAGYQFMRQGLATFEASFENTPGRLNIYQELPFTVIMDFAHNPDGMEKLCAYTDQLQVPGRRLLLCSRSGKQTDQEIASFTRFVAKHFDHFTCRRYGKLYDRRPGEVSAVMRSTLLEVGVPEDCIGTLTDPQAGTRRILDEARPGDLVVLTPGTKEVDRMWQEILAYKPRHDI